MYIGTFTNRTVTSVNLAVGEIVYACIFDLYYAKLWQNCTHTILSSIIYNGVHFIYIKKSIYIYYIIVHNSNNTRDYSFVYCDTFYD